MSSLPYSKVIDIDDFSNPTLRPFLNHISYDEMVRFGLDSPPSIPDSKQWECAMMLRTFSDFGLLQKGRLMCGIGAGTEQTTFALAEKGCITFPTDRYLEVTPWSDVAPAPMMIDPAQYTKFKYERGHVIPVHTDARMLDLPTEFFDGVYSAGSIEHFGSLDAVAAAAQEIGRILKPGGVAALSTEFRLEGPNGINWFDDNCILFTPALLEKYIIAPSGLELIGPLNASISDKTFDSRVVLLDFLSKATKVKTLDDKENAYPNLVLFHDGFLFCSVHIALRKAPDIRSVKLVQTSGGGFSAEFEKEIHDQKTVASGVMTQQIHDWKKRFGRNDDEVVVQANEIETLKALNEKYASSSSQCQMLAFLLDDLLSSDSAAILTASAKTSGSKIPSFSWNLDETFWPERINTVVGLKEGNILKTDGRHGVLCFGPYISVPQGRYKVEFDIAVLSDGDGSVACDVCLNSGGSVAISTEVRTIDISKNFVDPTPISLVFDLYVDTDGIEFRTIVSTTSIIAVRSIRLYSRKLANFV